MSAPKLFAYKPSLAQSYFQMSLAVYGTKAEGLRRLNAALRTRYAFGHISRWERGASEPDRTARLYMMRDVLPWLMSEAGLLSSDAERNTDRVLDKLAPRLV